MRTFLSKLIKENIHINLVEGELSVKIPNKGIDPSIIEEIKSRKQDLIAYLSDLKKIGNQNYVGIENTPKAKHYRISSAQHRLWILNQFEDQARAYNIFTQIELEGKQDIPAFKEAIFSVIKRHEILRTVFKEIESGEVRQFILEPEDFNFVIDYKDYRDQENSYEACKSYIDDDSYKPFDLVNGPLLRAGLLRVSNDKFIFHLNMHHIISDDWSLGVLSQDVMRYYEANRAGVSANIPELKIQYKDYSAWQFNRTDGKGYKESEEYWLERLSGEMPRIDLPTSKLRPKFKTSNGRYLSTFLSEDLSDRMYEFIKLHQGSLFILTLSAINVLMYKYTSNKNVLIGSPVAGRSHPDLEDQIGFYINILALKNIIDPANDFIEFYDKVKENVIKDFGHQEYPYDKLVEILGLSYDASRTPLYDVLLTFHGDNDDSNAREIDKSLFSKIKDGGAVQSKNDIEFHLMPLGDAISFEVIFNSDVYEIDMIITMMGDFKNLLSSFLSDPKQILGDVEYLTNKRKYKILSISEGVKKNYPDDATFVHLFSKQVKKTPNAIAVVFEDEELTYKELDQKSNQLASCLVQKGIKKEDLVAMCIEKRTEMIIGILAVLKSGGAYVPIDPNYPRERIDFIIEDTNSSIILSSSGLYDIVKVYTAKDVIYLDQELESNQSFDFSEIELLPSNLAYVIYTSGSTGKPKGVKIEHKTLINFLFSMRDDLGFDHDLKFLSLTTFIFDISILEFLSPLFVGGMVILVNDVGSKTPDYVNQIVKDQKPTCIQATPTHWQILINNGLDTNSDITLLSGGEAISEELKEQLTNISFNVWNLYGPTETTIWSCISRLEKNQKITIGKPIANTQILILDEYLSLVPKGAVGELCISGLGLSRGYLNRDKLTNEKFVQHPFKKEERLYRTGDLARWTPDGTLEFIGRKDDQVKIRGHRIELGEIGNVLSTLEEIEMVVVVAKKSISGDKDLVAYYTCSTDLNSSDLRHYLQEHLPSYMVPNYFVAIKEMPLTANGKINRKALPNHEDLELNNGFEYVPARNEIEKKLVSIWEKVLGRVRIGIKDDFFDLGGHSLKIIRLINEYHITFDVKLGIKDIFSNPKLETHLGLLSSFKKNDHLIIPNVAKELSYPISDAQRRLWILSQFDGGNISYNMPSSILLDGDYDILNFKRSINSVLDRHEILRTVFKEDSEGEVRQVILDIEEIGLEIEHKDYRQYENPEEQARLYIQEDSYKPFNLETGPLLRFSLLQVSDSDNIFYFNMHHIISDGWSMDVLSRDVLSYYKHYSGDVLKLPDLRIQYKDYATWQLTNLTTNEYNVHRNYWVDKLSGNLPLLDLPSYRHRPLKKTYDGRHLSMFLDEEDTQLIRSYIEQKDGTLFMFLIASLKVLLYRYTGEEDIIIGSPIAGRDHSELEDQIGFYANTLVLRNTLNGTIDFNEFYDQVKQGFLEAYAHQMYPFDRLVEDLDLRRDTSRSALFDMLVILQNKIDYKSSIEKLKKDIGVLIDHGKVPCNFDIEFNFVEVGDNLRLGLTYNENVYDHNMIVGFVSNYQRLIKVLILNEDICINELNYLQESEREELLHGFNDTEVDYANNKTVLDLFKEQVINTPNASAIIFNDLELTYKEVDEQSNKLANFLLSKYNIEIEDLIGVKLERNELLIISLLAILKIGAAYVPIDPDYPKERIEYIEKDSNSKVIIDGVVLEEFRLFKETSSEQPKIELVAGNLIYVIYTSGSTGQPKGVMITHNNVVSFLENLENEFRFKGLNIVAATTNFVFDISFLEIFGTLCSGRQMVLFSSEELMSTDLFTRKLQKNQVEILQVTPSRFSSLEEDILKVPLPNLKLLLIGGESFPNSLFLKKSSFKEINILNVYGPTEATIWSTYSDIKSSDSINIGTPLANEQIYILSDHMQLQCKGVIGEICIGGDGLARGYLNRPELTKEKFVEIPILEGKRLYKTGDLGRWLPDGNLEFMGRKDSQIKLRGHRIELEEIEHVLEKQAGVNRGVVNLKNEGQEGILVAYIVTETTLDKQDLRISLSKELPDYMIPGYFVFLEFIPLTPNGKVDKKSLPEISEADAIRNTYVAPRNEVEEELVNIWQEILGIEKISITDNFFALGGHSLKVTQIINKIKVCLNKEVKLKDVFEYPTILDLVSHLTEKTYKKIPQTVIKDHYSLSPSQHRLWVLSQFEGGDIAYNIPGVFRLRGVLDIAKLTSAFNKIIARHESLRTVFKEDDLGNIRQFIRPSIDVDFTLEIVNLIETINIQKDIHRIITESLSHSFDLASDVLLRVVLVQEASNEYALIYNMHHIISDGWSMELLIKEVMIIYNELLQGKDIVLPDLSIQYKDYAEWVMNELDNDSFQESSSYWLDVFKGELPVLELPTQKVRPKIKTFNGNNIDYTFSQEFTNKVYQFSNQENATIFMVLMASINGIFYRYTNDRDIVIGTPLAGREHPELEHQIGLYLNTLAIRTQFEDQVSFSELVSIQKQILLDAYSHQNYPFDTLVDQLKVRHDTSRSALFDVLVVLQNQQTLLNHTSLTLEGLEFLPYNDTGGYVSQFDLSFSFVEGNQELSLNLEYNTDIYDVYFIKKLITHLENFVINGISNPNEQINHLKYLSKNEQEMLLENFNSTAVDYPKDKTILDVFKEQVLKTPNKIAIVFNDKKLTYNELDSLSNELSNYLLSNYEIALEDLVGVKLERSEWLIISLLAVFKSGAAYVPIDIDYPEERIEYIEKDSKCKVTIDSVVLEKFKSSKEILNEHPKVMLLSKNAAYVMYTSGSTGKPKGVTITHSNVSNLLYWYTSQFNITEKTVTIQLTDVSFDPSIEDIFGTLTMGGVYHVIPKKTLLNIDDLREYIDYNKVTIVNYVPKYLFELLGNKPKINSIESVITGGEKLQENIKIAILEAGYTLYNNYGPTETTVDVLSGEMFTESNYIGKPINNTKIYILDSNKQMVPIGVPGQLCVSGQGLAKGYLNRPELTKQKFVSNPFEPKEKLYLTGDLAKWTRDGNIIFKGREDNQLKIRGYRIELGEIEKTLNTCINVDQAVVLAKDNKGEKVIVAFLLGKDIELDSLLVNLRRQLPDYMIPSYFKIVDQIPLNSNGKVDQKVLLDQTINVVKKDFVPPNNELEIKLAGIWENILGVKQIGMNDNFFELGGHSIKAVKIISEVQNEFGVKIEMSKLFLNPTMLEMSKEISKWNWMNSEVVEEDIVDKVTI